METSTIVQMTPTQALKDYYGFDQFRPPQEEIVHDLISGQDLLVLMPTGGGKSLCYQIPALVRSGVGIVVSPLIALMEDQVTALKLLGIRAAFYNSSLSAKEAREVLSSLHQQSLDLLYIAPERLLSSGFLERIQECQISLFAIDEAHCISQWGHDFRPEYAALGALKSHFPEIPIIALTATADKQTQSDIVRRLNYSPKQYVASFNRPNIYYRVFHKANPIKQIQQFLENRTGQSGIVYCNTRATVERVASKLQELGYKARAYHAGLSHQERREVQHLFRYDQIDIVVATIAFGMGIDKPNVRFVIHHDLPKNIESYYQETGRAGRDGMPAEALLLYEPGDSAHLRGLITMLPQEDQQRIETHKLNHILAFAETSQCRRQILLRYFDEIAEVDCQYCDVCDNPPETVDATVEAQKILSCVYRLRQSYGLIHVIDVIRGSQNDKIKQAGHDKLSTYGIGQDKSTTFWRHLLWQLIHLGYCYQDIAHYSVLKLTAKASALLKGEVAVYITLPKQEPKEKVKKSKREKNTVAPASSPLFEALRKLRRQLADAENKPPFMIFSDNTLHDMVALRPRSREALLSVSGVGQHKLGLYGDAFLEVIAEETR